MDIYPDRGGAHPGLTAAEFRESNVLKLEWQQIDMQRGVAWVHPDQAKASKAIGIPLNKDAINILRKQLGKIILLFLHIMENPKVKQEPQPGEKP